LNKQFEFINIATHDLSLGGVTHLPSRVKKRNAKTSEGNAKVNVENTATSRKNVKSNVENTKNNEETNLTQIIATSLSQGGDEDITAFRRTIEKMLQVHDQKVVFKAALEAMYSTTDGTMYSTPDSTTSSTAHNTRPTLDDDGHKTPASATDGYSTPDRSKQEILLDSHAALNARLESDYYEGRKPNDFVEHTIQEYCKMHRALSKNYEFIQGIPWLWERWKRRGPLRGV